MISTKIDVKVQGLEELTEKATEVIKKAEELQEAINRLSDTELEIQLSSD